MEMAQQLIDWLQKMVEKVFGFFGFYTENYSKYLVWGLLLFIASKILKLKVDVKAGK